MLIVGTPEVTKLGLSAIDDDHDHARLKFYAGWKFVVWKP